MVKPIKNILDTLFNAQTNWQVQLLQQWETIVGTLKTPVHLLKIFDDTVVIGVQDSCWMQELYLLSPWLIQSINNALDKPRIKHIRFRALGTTQKKEKKETQVCPTPKKIILLTHKENAVLTSVKDDQLRASLKEYLIRCSQQR